VRIITALIMNTVNWNIFRSL